MQQFKSKFKDDGYKGTISNIQSCLRLNDIDEIGDGQHLLYFNMIGLFSFREKSVKWAIDYWMGFLSKINLKPDYVTIHPNRSDWRNHYDEYDVDIRFDEGCIWSDGNIGGYCTEFYIDDIEIGNIVNPLDTCIDCGFGLERLEMILSKKSKTKNETLVETISKMIECNILPSYNKQGSILRRLIRLLYKEGGFINNEIYIKEVERIDRLYEVYNRYKKRHRNKSKEWWWNTHGIDLDDYE